MRDQAVGQADALSLALAEPDQHVRRRWILGLTLASLGMWMATQTIRSRRMTGSRSPGAGVWKIKSVS